jgi:hypothetical protein
MLNHKFTKLKIFTVSLLLNTNFYGAVSEASAPDSIAETSAPDSTGGLIDETKYRDAISIWRSPESSKAQKECAMNLLNEIGVSPSDMYDKSAVDRAESEEWKDLARNVVKVRTNSSFGTGTVVSFPGFEGRVVLTCAHCVFPEGRKGLGNLSGFNSGLSVEWRGQQMLMFSCFCLEGRPYGMFNLRENDPDSYVFVSVSGGSDRELDFFDPERRANAVERVCLLNEDNMSQDFCVLILKEPMRDDEGVIPGIPFEKLIPMESLEVESHEFPSPRMFLEHIVTPDTEQPTPDTEQPIKRIVTPEQPMIIGYGHMGVDDDEKFRKFEDKVSSSLIQEIMGRGLKKAVCLRGLELAKSGGEEHIMAFSGESRYYHNMEWLIKNGPEFMEEIEGYIQANIEQGNLCVQANMRECAKLRVKYAQQEIERMQGLLQYGQATIKGFHALRPFYSYSQVGDGFSGSLVVTKLENGNLNVYGLFSGGVFRHEEKCFIENAVQHHMATQSLQESTYCYQPTECRDQPAECCDQPTECCDQPAECCDQPAECCDQPAPRRFQPRYKHRQPWQGYRPKQRHFQPEQDHRQSWQDHRQSWQGYREPWQDYGQPWQDYLLSARDKHTRRRFQPTEKGLCWNWITCAKNNRSMRRSFRR